MIYSKYPLKVLQEVEPFPPIQNTDNPYLTEAAMRADQSNQLQGYGYLVDGVGAFTYLGTVAGTAADYKGFIVTTGLSYLETDLNVNQGQFLHILNPKRGTRTLNSSNTAGAIKISLPAFQTSNIFSFTINLFGLSTSIGAEDNAVITVSGINNGFVESKENIVSIKTSNVLSDYTIRFGHDGVTDCIWIGEVAYTFRYVAIAITNLFVQGGSTDVWKNAFDINRVQSFDTVQLTKTNNLAAADFDKLKNKPVGVSGSFTTVDSKTVTVTDGIITSIV